MSQVRQRAAQPEIHSLADQLGREPQSIQTVLHDYEKFCLVRRCAATSEACSAFAPRSCSRKCETLAPHSVLFHVAIGNAPLVLRNNRRKEKRPQRRRGHRAAPLIFFGQSRVSCKGPPKNQCRAYTGFLGVPCQGPTADLRVFCNLKSCGGPFQGTPKKPV